MGRQQEWHVKVTVEKTGNTVPLHATDVDILRMAKHWARRNRSRVWVTSWDNVFMYCLNTQGERA